MLRLCIQDLDWGEDSHGLIDAIWLRWVPVIHRPAWVYKKDLGWQEDSHGPTWCLLAPGE